MKTNSKFQQKISHLHCDHCGSNEHDTANCPNIGVPEPDLGNTTGKTGKSGKWTDENTNTLIENIGNVFSSWLSPTPTSNVTNNYNQRDNTLLYIGIGGAVLVVVLILVFALRK